MPTLLQSLGSWRRGQVIVVGDFMLDELVYGDAERLSADAPVPVLHVRRSEDRPGGAASVCANLAALQMDVSAVGVVGDDAPGQRLRALLEQAGVDTSALLVDPSRPTTTKQSLIGLAQHRHAQKMFRVDRESREPLAGNVAAALLEAFAAKLNQADVVCIEDYAKGVCAEAVCRRIIESATNASKDILVDPALLDDYTKYRGATAITPNRSEAAKATGIDHSSEPGRAVLMAERLQKQTDIDVIALTLDKEGALLLEKNAQPRIVPTLAREVYDVTGAGDMVLAALAAGRAAGLDWPTAVELANLAAGLEVEQLGVVPIPLEAVHHQLMLQSGKLRGKVRTTEELLLEVEARRKVGETIVFTNGCFDVLHSGHVKLIEQAASYGHALIVAINDDASVRRLKGPDRPVNTLEERARVLGGLGSVDMVVAFSQDTPTQLIEAIRPDVLVKGGDYKLSEVVGGEFVTSYGGRVELIPPVEGVSSTKTIRRIQGGAPQP